MAPRNQQTEFLMALRNGDNQLLKSYFEELYIKLSVYSFRITRDKDITRILVRESFTKLWENRMKVDHPKQWLYTVVRNDSFTWLKEQRKDRELEEGLENFHKLSEDPIINQIIAAEVKADLFQRIDQLPEECKKILILVKIDELSITEAAEKLELSPQTIKNQLTKALKLLRNNPPIRD